MSDFNSVKAQIQSLIDSANATTGNTDTNLTDGVNALIGGYGQGESGGAELNIHYGDTAPTDTTKLWIDINEPNDVVVKYKLDISEETLYTENVVLPSGLTEMGVGVVGKKIYIFGGIDASSTESNAIYIFDTETSTVSVSSATLPVTCYGLGVGVVGKKIYVFGGKSALSPYRFATIHVYNTETDTLETSSTVLPQGLYYMGVGVVGKKIYILGGYASSATSTVYVYDTETNVISTNSKSLSTAKQNMAVAVIDEKIYLFGGRSSSGNTATNMVFDTVANTCSSFTPSLPVQLYGLGACAIGTKIYLFGGYSNGTTTGAVSTIYVYDTEANTLTTSSAKLNKKTIRMGVGVVGSSIYLIGGEGNYTAIEKLLIKSELNSGKLLVLPSVTRNLFDIIVGGVTVTLGVYKVFLGNSDGYAEEVNAYLYQNGEWTPI